MFHGTFLMRQRSDIINVHDSLSPVATGNTFIIPGVKNCMPQLSTCDPITQDMAQDMAGVNGALVTAYLLLMVRRHPILTNVSPLGGGHHYLSL